MQLPRPKYYRQLVIADYGMTIMIFVAGGTMKKATKGLSIKTAQALLAKHECPVPFHEVRTPFLGDIATPEISASPLQIIKDLGGGELPPFDSIEEINHLLDALVQGLWNDLTRHQKRSQPFRLTRVATEPNVVVLGRYGLVHLQELDGFIEGLFDREDVIDLPERLHEAADRLAEMRAMMAGLVSWFGAHRMPTTAPSSTRRSGICAN